MSQDNITQNLETIAKTLKRRIKVPRGQSPVAVYDAAASLLKAYCQRMNDGLVLYHPINKTIERFHKSKARIRLASGANQSGKTTAAVAEVVRIWRGMDPYSKRSKRDLRLLIVGKDIDHIGQVIFSKMWWPGLFSIIRDQHTGAYRAVRPSAKDPSRLDPYDLAHKDEWLPSPPLLPPDSIKKLAWEKKNQAIPRRIVLVNDSEASFFSSKGSPRQGVEMDLFYCDEEMENRDWLNEGRARLLRRDGLMIASFTPQASTPEYYDLHLRAEGGDRGVKEFHLTLESNPYITKSAKRALFNDLKDDPAELAVRYYGHYAIQGRKVYPEYSIDSHGIDDFPIPSEWMRLVCIDPGAQYQTALFAAVPPKADEIHIYDEIHLLNANAFMLANTVKEKLGGLTPEVFMIDYRGGKQRPMGYSNTVAEHYEEAFHKAGLRSRTTSYTFVYTSDDVSGREQSLKRWLRPDDRGRPLVYFHRGKTESLDRQIKNRYYMKTDATKRDNRPVHDLADCLEYIAAYFDTCVGSTEYGLFYEPASRASPRLTPQFQAYLKMERYYKKLESRNRRGISLG